MVITLPARALRDVLEGSTGKTRVPIAAELEGTPETVTVATMLPAVVGAAVIVQIMSSGLPGKAVGAVLTVQAPEDCNETITLAATVPNP